MEKKAIVAGASGAIGNSLLFHLLGNKNYAHVLILVRSELRIQHPKLQQLVVDYDRISDYAAQLNADVVFCCLGTTKSKTPDQRQYKKIDYQYPLDIARITSRNGSKGFHLISSIGADKNSKMFYTRTKGEVENDLQQVPFDDIHIYRPSLLDAPRKDKRFMESSMNIIMNVINPVLIGGLKKYRSIRVEDIAKTMIRLSLEDKKGIFVHESDEIQKLSEGDTTE
ncbi:NAD(P)H-binding protein [Pedobacter westerhofensis]|nr:NAD(P)H-binding protein [Pedobacter westerhofensis]